MRFFPVLMFLGLVACGQATQPAAKFDSSKLDKVKLEEYVRHVELWTPQLHVVIDDPKPATSLPGYFALAIHLDADGKTYPDENYLISADARYLFKGDATPTEGNPFQANLDKLRTTDQPQWGNPKAALKIVVFGDFECPICKEEAKAMRGEMKKEFGDQVQVFFEDYPLDSIHPWAHVAALAGRCVYKTGEDNFWKYHDWIYDVQESVKRDNFLEKFTDYAGKNGMNATQLRQCVDSKSTEPEVARTRAEGRALGVNGTPTVYLNGRRLGGTPWPTLERVVASELSHTNSIAGSESERIESMLRYRELLSPQVAVKAGDRVASKYWPGFKEFTLHLSQGQQSAERSYYLSDNGKWIARGEVYDLTKSPFQKNLDTLKTELQPSYGTPGAQAVIAVFTDFTMDSPIPRKALLEAFPNQTRVYFKEYPTPGHPWAKTASIAARCVFRADPAAYWKFSDWASGAKAKLTAQNFRAEFGAWLAKSGLSADSVSSCLDSKATEAEVDKSVAEGNALGVDGLPTLFVNGRKLTQFEWPNLQALLGFELNHQTKVPDAGEKCCQEKSPSVLNR